MDMDDADVPVMEREDLLGLSLASLSLTEDHGDLKVRICNMVVPLAGSAIGYDTSSSLDYTAKNQLLLLSYDSSRLWYDTTFTTLVYSS